MRRAQAGDFGAYAELVRRYVRLGGAVAYQVLGDYDQAADTVQDAFLRVQRALPSLREPERFRGWFYGVVRSVAVDRLRRDRRWKGMARLGGAGPDDSGDGDPGAGASALQVIGDPLGALSEGEERVAVRQAIAALPASYREVIALKYLDERSYEEIAALLDTTVEAVESRLHRARAKLKQKLGALARERS